MSGHKAQIRHRASHQIERGKPDQSESGPIQLEVKSGDPASGLPSAIVLVTDEWTLVPLVDRVVSVRKA